jgi:hypothetical protein
MATRSKPSSRARALTDWVSARQGAAALLEKRDVAEPAPVGAPLVFQAHRGGEPLLDGGEAQDVRRHLDHLGKKAARAQNAFYPRLVVGEARDLARLSPLVDVEGDHGEALPRSESPACPLDDGIGGAEIGGDDIRLPASVFLALHVRLVELHVGEAGLTGEAPRVGEGARIPVQSHGMLDARGKPEGHPPRSAADIEGALAFQALGLEQGEEARGEEHATQP